MFEFSFEFIFVFLLQIFFFLPFLLLPALFSPSWPSSGHDPAVACARTPARACSCASALSHCPTGPARHPQPPARDATTARHFRAGLQHLRNHRSTFLASSHAQALSPQAYKYPLCRSPAPPPLTLAMLKLCATASVATAVPKCSPPHPSARCHQAPPLLHARR